jgi:hypothetical protein
MNPVLKDGDCRFGPSFELGPILILKDSALKGRVSSLEDES